MSAEDLITISEISREDFGSLCICAIRYCLGRKTYMPSIVQRVVTTNISYLSDMDLHVIYDDIKKHSGPLHEMDAYGTYEHYKDWQNFLRIVTQEIKNRDNELNKECEGELDDKL